nr:MAG TPA: hypothetical protein [Caudoviricetes sp.]
MYVQDTFLDRESVLNTSTSAARTPPSVRFGTKAYVCARYFLRPGKCFKYINQCGEDTTEHVYEVMALYPYCVLLRDTRNGVRTCPGYNTLSLMLRGSETYE